MTTAKSPKTIDEYIRQFTAPVQTLLSQIRQLIRDLAPDAAEAMAYGIPTFQLNGNLVHFAGFAKHIGFYPAPTGIQAFKAELAPYKHSKGAVQFPLDKPIPFDLITRIVRFRMAENMGKLQPINSQP